MTHENTVAKCYAKLEVEIDRYIGLPIFFPIFKHFTIIGYQKKKKKRYKFLSFLIVTYTIIQSIISSEMCSLHLTHPSAHTPGAVGTHTPGAVGTHLEQWTHTHTHTHTHTRSRGHCSLRRSSSTTTACNFIQDSIVWNTLNYINIFIFSTSDLSLSIVLCKYIDKPRCQQFS